MVKYQQPLVFHWYNEQVVSFCVAPLEVTATEQKTILKSVVLCVPKSNERGGKQIAEREKDRGGERLMKVTEKEKVWKNEGKEMSLE